MQDTVNGVNIRLQLSLLLVKFPFSFANVGIDKIIEVSYVILFDENN